MKLDYLLDLAINASNKASEVILKERKNLKIWTKDDKTPVSSADLAASTVISEILSQSDYKIFSEEKILHYEERKDLEYFWLIDPLDGTSGFLKGSNEFCIMISLIYLNRPILAIIKNPLTSDIFYAHKKTKVYKNNNILNIDKKRYEKNKLKALLSVNHLSKEDEKFANEYQLEAINIGSGLKFCAILEGRAGVYKRFEKLNIWDIAAGDFLINQNGGFMGDFQKKLILYNDKSYKANPFIALSQKEFMQDFL